jgi:hypothetical protein
MMGVLDSTNALTIYASTITFPLITCFYALTSFFDLEGVRSKPGLPVAPRRAKRSASIERRAIGHCFTIFAMRLTIAGASHWAAPTSRPISSPSRFISRVVGMPLTASACIAFWEGSM